MAKADDSNLDPDQLLAVQLAARRALDRASGWGIFPTPTEDILAAANLRVAPASAFDPRRIMEFLIGKAEDAAIALKSAISKVLGIYDDAGAREHLGELRPNIAAADDEQRSRQLLEVQRSRASQISAPVSSIFLRTVLRPTATALINPASPSPVLV